MVIHFYKSNEPYGCFSNFAGYPVEMDGKVWPTSEHYFQAQKFPNNPEYQEKIREQKSPMIAKRLGANRKIPMRSDWDSYRNEVMYRVVKAKFQQHADICEILLSTGDESLAEHTERDSYWADAGDGSGGNMLGKILMRVRKELFEERRKQQ